jgi:LPPG:FO 2-phospho-L-lactate transferase
MGDLHLGVHDRSSPVRVAVLAGGVGGAKLADGLQMVLPPGALTVIVNTGDDLVLHGLHVSPDLDTVMYTLAGEANPETGWGLRDETWSAAALLERYGSDTWFRLGDRDLATHIVRTDRLRAGATLTEATRDLAGRLGVPSRVLPMTDAPVRTRLRTDAGWLDFQDYFVRRRHADDVRDVVFDGAADARPTPAVLDAIAGASLIAIAPSNPFVSVGTILAVPGILEAILGAPAPVVAVSPIVAGAALRGPADRMFVTLGGEPSAVGVARHYVERYPGLLDGLVIDQRDEGQAAAIEALGIRVRAAETVMVDEGTRAALAREVLALGARLAGA